MNFAAFKLWREACIRTVPDVVDCAETNLYSALAPLQPRLDPSDTHPRVHRCDLARAWLQRYGFDTGRSRQALVCRGVRHALQLIFKRLSAEGARLWLPSDVYPVYQALAQSAGIAPQTFPTLPAPSFPMAGGTDGPEFLLIANPLKPLGRFLNDEECAALVAWVNAAPGRRLLIDCVYDLGAPFHSTTMQLLQTERAILLHSTTKGWLTPQTFGVALVGEDCAGFESDFREDPPAAMQLQLAHHFLSVEADCPARVVDALQARARRLAERLPEAIRDAGRVGSTDCAPGCYLFPVPLSAEQLLHTHGLVAIPASAFGAEGWSGSILTSLSDSFAPQHHAST
ncbi:aminotransferase class I/II-fold pyridoxal phosphate-dependent enzyme [Ralstonia insidiosa]|jgi:aspartate/methionine/tyrosine aminotransferase|uniref:aminotransferase class I/II-fold pyridoxal phosphate-dependent enzyme n=1 Tax=Ralstonia TaxID=48736 RepID=UPI000664BA61|nr:aminotransferase class I/II-fold pyridoxal phosphate-dependent enzyme [Ralstonia insidiosa]KMW45674.1 aspartate aminotransferase [Ralstonia sp. MD27]MBX3772527.1 aminotransferase class I/II-fold pyridoxal phosphate-dependent enzyme [Ralstonia pickettii]NOZ18342.1 aminotransferase class I/II-fold pyridoxal phosphate-dependent enzyme [Betaproteobacteria bacterium]MBA9857183.1 aminotransferase class I/II-fold pyridoxal phosphate-dependent enzyme [Ralstonia insidiosa]MBA9870285.1 aminotransfera